MTRALAIVAAVAAAIAVGSIAFRPAPSDPGLRAVFEGSEVTVLRHVPGQRDEELFTLDLTDGNAWMQAEAVMRAAVERHGSSIHHVDVEADAGTPWPWIAWVLTPVARLGSGFDTIRFRVREGAEALWRIPARTVDEMISSVADVARTWNTMHVHVGRRGRIDVSAFGLDQDEDRIVRRAEPLLSVLPGRPGDVESMDQLARTLAAEREARGGRLFLALSFDRPGMGARPFPSFDLALDVIRVCLAAETEELQIDLAHLFLIGLGSDDDVTPARR